MGYIKRFITEDILREIYENDGHGFLVDNITKPESLYIADDFSEKIVSLVMNGDSEEKIKECFETK